MSTPRTGFIGLGSQGGPMARRMVDQGYPLTIWARRAATMEPYADTPAVVASTPADVGAGSDIVGICVVADDDVEEVLLGTQGVAAGMQPGGVVMIHSTIHPETCRRLATELAARDLTLLDAPVSGGGMAAAEQRLLVMVGCDDDDAFARCRPVLETFADPIIHLGGVGAGQAAKAINNLVLTAQIAVAVDTYGLADGIDVDRAALADVLANGSGGSRAAGFLAASGFNLDGLRSAAPLLRKDVNIALDLAKTAGAPPPAVLANLADTALKILDADG